MSRAKETMADVPPMPPPPPFTLVIDTREQTPLTFDATIPTVRAGLKTGDYSIAGHEDEFTVERKSLADLVHTLIHDRERFGRELERMRAFAFRRVLCTSSMNAVRRGKYAHSRANPHSVVALACAFQIRYDVPFVFASDADDAAKTIEEWARYYVREHARRERERTLAERTDTPTPSPLLGSFRAPSPCDPMRRGERGDVIPTTGVK